MNANVNSKQRDRESNISEIAIDAQDVESTMAPPELPDVLRKLLLMLYQVTLEQPLNVQRTMDISGTASIQEHTIFVDFVDSPPCDDSTLHRVKLTIQT